MSEHTKGRLVAEKGLFSWVVRWDFGARGIWCDDLDENEARRLAACWNAFDGVSPPILDCIVENGGVLLLLEKASSTERELTAARALLRKVLSFGLYEQGATDEMHSEGVELTERVKSYLDACDTLEGAPNAG